MLIQQRAHRLCPLQDGEGVGGVNVPRKEVERRCKLREKRVRPAEIACAQAHRFLNVESSALGVLRQYRTIQKLFLRTAPTEFVRAVVWVKVGFVPYFPIFDIHMVSVCPALVKVANDARK